MTATAEGAGSVLDRTRLLKDLQAQARLLEDDLRRRTDDEPEFRDALRAEYEKAVAAERTAAMYETWRDDRVVQIAAAWVLACVFVRFSEDNGLIADPWFSGPGDRLAEAQDRHDAYFRANPSKNDRDWLLDSFDALAKSHRTVAGLFDRTHNPLYEVTPSYEAATALLAFWRQRGADGGIVHDFTDPELDTRFLGDLYQDLSEHARKTYALLQTPVFVEEFILDLTLEPAVEEFGLTPAWKHRPGGWDGEVFADGPDGADVVRGLRCIDPACGSGHFLLGLFERLLAKWREAEPGTEPWVLVRRALESVHGADKNPFAVAIARFRLLVAALKACGVRELGAAPELPIRVAVADSLLHGRGAETVTEALDTLFAENEPFYYRTEDVEGFAREVDLLGRGSYHVVVGNPPYITVKDANENKNYKGAYDACYRQYALSVPFAQRIFELGIRAGGDHRDGGFTGQITANSFMKREFGKKLIEEFFPRVDLTHVIDTSGAYIPGHGTPTVILAGRNQVARKNEPVRAVLGVRGEPGQPEDPADGLVWRAIRAQVGVAGSESEWVSTEDLARVRFTAHPWSLSGGGASDVMQKLSSTSNTLKNFIFRIGFYGDSHADESFTLPVSGPLARRAENLKAEVSYRGDQNRDWNFSGYDLAVHPYDNQGDLLKESDLGGDFISHFWPWRTELWMRGTFGGSTYRADGRKWWEWHQRPKDEEAGQSSIAFAFVATHNHFTLDQNGKVFNRSAPVIKLPEGTSEERHLELLGVLNSSAACFWLKQVSQGKGGSGVGCGIKDEAWEERYEFTGTKLQEFPLPGQLPLALGRELHALAQASTQHAPSVLARNAVPTRVAMDDGRQEQGRARARMIALQEELDWTIYGAYGLLTADEVARTTVPDTDTDLPEVALGQRAFEIVLARSGAETAWFDRHGSTPVTEVPAHWPESYRKVVQARIDLIEANKDIRLIERPEYKRRWSTEPWEKREAAALRNWLLDAAEREELWFEERDGFTVPRPLTVNQLADELRHDDDVQAVAELYAADHLGKRDASLATVLAAVIEAEHVPYLAALRYKDSGLRKRAQWEQVWEQQREEDRTGQRLDIKVPPKYTSADFTKNSYWSHRGKLDVPKERFISYPGASLESDISLLLGWAGWNHRDQADALVGLVRSRIEDGGWEKKDPRLVPLLAGLREVLPWVHQWHGEYDEEWEGNPAEEFQAALDSGRADAELSENDLVAWRPEKKTRGRQKKSE
ncbi:BREX-2 system adenine-specific DNA-methyltransferase PglX [Streptomyces sp. MAR25Y5]|uniref:BREX-2 system adenine-specific DNA-methyltransferase PglX n=1 Tax=Streptomyces sp. MAR25Y5 TaxID=2962028 RepID=UPI0020B77EDE|nr:BREX-2 system adenine-specific DNA-methyltransferase PglX [Streptomyces sp. MAR25Y5]MCP3766527.1 BREX-2 system adenine-specific DNA-methyltransferase PglX [Streptomyces sp. MAR25Y5]